jgi:TolB protein
VYDLSTDGSLRPVADVVRTTLANDLDLAGAFRRLPASAVPSTGALFWLSDEAFDYIGWAEAGAWMVVTAEVAPAPAGVRIRLDAWMVEEGDRLLLPRAEAEVPVDRAPAVVQGWVNHLLRCITTVPGAYGSRITYARRLATGLRKQIWVAEFGSDVQALVSDDKEGVMLPAWAPGGRIAWTGYKAGNPDVYLDGVSFSARPGMNTGIAFSPDGRLAALTLAPDGNPDLYLLNGRTGDEVARLTSGRGIDTSPAWSPDGRRIAFVSDRSGGPQIWTMNADGTEPHPLPLPGEYNSSPDWSPDGALIAYQSRGEGDRFAIWTVDVRTGDARPLTSGRTNDEEPSWSPDGRRIAYTSAPRRGRKGLWVMDRDGAHAHVIFKDDGDFFTPAWERTWMWGQP